MSRIKFRRQEERIPTGHQPVSSGGAPAERRGNIGGFILGAHQALILDMPVTVDYFGYRFSLRICRIEGECWNLAVQSGNREYSWNGH